MASDANGPLLPPLGAAEHVDVMNDPQHDPPPADDRRASHSEPEDHCRICRSEGSKEEPLFHPCKCSGSIKFVHQDCLMEWLQHSQKKYCELCKTPFTFTKVYAPEMPSRIPTPLFVRRLLRHMVENALLWARAGLVALVWLGCLPWLVRWMWRAWFWFSDGVWFAVDPDGSPTSQAATAAATATSATATSPSLSFIALSFLRSYKLNAASSPINGGAVGNVSIQTHYFNSSSQYTDGIFFDSNPFATLTPYPFINRLIVDTLEGQLLTALIVVSFILVFLIREWVVQQQPALAGGADDAVLLDLDRPLMPPAVNAAEEAGPVEQEQGDEQEQHEEQDREQEDPDEDILNRAFGPIQPEERDDPELPMVVQGEPAQRRVIAQPRRRRVFPNTPPPEAMPGTSQASDNTEDARMRETSASGDQASQPANEAAEGSTTPFTFGADMPQRPQPTRENTSQVTEIRRRVEESGSVSDSSSAEFNFTPPNHQPTFPFPAAERSWDAGSDEFVVVEGGRSVEDPRSVESTEPPRGDTTPQGPHSPPPLGGTQPSDASDNRQLPQPLGWEAPTAFDNIFGMQSSEIAKEHELPDVSNEGTEGTENKELEQGPSDTNFLEQTHGEQAIASESTVSSSTRPSEWSMATQADVPPLIPVDRSASQSPAAVLNNPPPPPEENDPNRDEPFVQEVPAQRLAMPLDDATLAALGPDIQRIADEHGLGVGDVRQELERFAAAPAGGDAPNLAGRRRGLMWPFGREIAVAADDDVNEEDNGDLDDEMLERRQQLDERRQQLDQAIADREQDIARLDARLEGAMADDDGADDFEGIMELVGMRGPLIGLIQNAAISSVLITATVAIGVVFPYVAGKTVMMVLAHPVLFFFQVPVLVMSFFAEFFVDSVTFLAFSFLLMFDQALKFLFNKLAFVVPALGLSQLTIGAAITRFLQTWASDGQNRITAKFNGLEATYLTMRRRSPVHPPFSVVAREGLANLCSTGAWGIDILRTQYSKYLAGSVTVVGQYMQQAGFNITSPVTYVSSALEKSFGSLNATSHALQSPQARALSPWDAAEMYRWSTWDKIAVVLLGYASFTVAGAIYLRTRRTATSSVEKFATEFLEQCGGVMKVVLIIGIEMFVFPLYCGILLDVAALPLFEGATIASRITFALEYPLTATFVHWFLGTCYMFHFALFVSMCRRIMKTGVLFFIRDPDDPNFHPVRDVLERPVVAQLRKIGFSAFVYGLLVIICLGGVVWSLAMTAKGVLPIHWSSNEPVLEFPVDLLFYNFLMPVAVKFFKPSDGLQNMYDWWFRKCARALRLSSFMFGERVSDEEGYHHRRTWKAWLLRAKGDVLKPVLNEEQEKEFAHREVYFKRNGRFVRGPASDTVRRRPKGSSVFIPVDEYNRRIDGVDDPEGGPFGRNSPEWRLIYLPPLFRARIALVVLGIWVFAAVTGVSITIGPLLLGRAILHSIVPSNVRLNDVYAFSVGIYIAGSVALAITKFPVAYELVRRVIAATPRPSAWANRESRESIKNWTLRVAKVSYVFAAFAIVLPTLVALMIEFYVIIPIHTYFLGDEQHVIHLIQDWTLGVLYVKMMGRMLLLDADSPWARALNGVVARGYFDPDVKLATQHFIAPATAFMLAALVIPLGLASFAVKVFGMSPRLLSWAARSMVVEGDVSAEDLVRSKTYRYAYPAVFLLACIVAACYGTYLLVERWRRSVRDEVYLIGERLHNHGEDHPPVPLHAEPGVEGPREVGGVEEQ